MKPYALCGISLALVAALAVGLWQAQRENAVSRSKEEVPERTAQEYEAELAQLSSSERGLPAAHRLAQLGPNADAQTVELLQAELADQRKSPAAALQEARAALLELEKELAATSDPVEKNRLQERRALVERIVASLGRM